MKVENITERYRKARLRWFGHGQGEMKVENITERYRKARLGWFGHGQGETDGREHHREVQERKTEVVWTWSGRD